MENITISMRRFEELLYKEAAYEMKRRELKQSGFVSMIDGMLFGVSKEAEKPEADDDF